MTQAAPSTYTADLARALVSRRVAETLLNCYCREIAGPEGQVSVGPRFGHNDWPEGLRRAARGGQVLHVLLPRVPARVLGVVTHASVTGNYRYLSNVYVKVPGRPWVLTNWRTLAALLIQDLAHAHGTAFNAELLAQIQDSVRVQTAILGFFHPPQAKAGWEAYLASEQGLTFGHAFHPAPKSRLGFTADDLACYSPEAGARFKLHWFAVHRDCLREDALAAPCAWLLKDTLPPACDADYAPIPVHPWQARWLIRHPLVRKAFDDGRLTDLGKSGPVYFATSSIRTLTRPGGRYFLKLSLHVRVTNCVRKNTHYELEGALKVTRILQGLRAEFTACFPCLRVLAEPAWRCVDLGEADTELNKEVLEGFGLILREGLDFNDSTPLLAGALLSEPESGFAPSNAEAWFDAYVGLLLPPVLHSYFAHGIVFEPHLQNVLVRVRGDQPVGIVLRDFEGVKLLPEYFPGYRLADVSPRAREALWYDAAHGWNRVAYCLFVNNFCEAVTSLARGDTTLERRLWGVVRHHLRRYQAEFGDPLSARKVNALLSGEPWPAKANLLNRFLKRPDRGATYVSVVSPLPSAEESRRWS